CRAGSRCTRCACRKGRISTRSISVSRDLSGAGGSGLGASDVPRIPSPEPPTPGSRRGRMLVESAVVAEIPVWLEVNGEPAVKGEHRKRVLASGCGAVSTFLADPHQVAHAPARGEPPAPARMRALFKDLFGRGERYNETGGIHAAALTDDERVLFHAEDIGR